MRPRIALIAALAALAAGCGSTTGEDRPGAEATVLLDFTPNAVHAGLYMATERGYDEAEGVRLEVRGPRGALAKLRDGRADFAILDVRALARARERGADLVGRVEVGAVRRERAVLAVAPARPRQRQREVAREGDPPPAHRRRSLRPAVGGPA